MAHSWYLHRKNWCKPVFVETEKGINPSGNQPNDWQKKESIVGNIIKQLVKTIFKTFQKLKGYSHCSGEKVGVNNWRFCGNYRRVITVMKYDRYPMPAINDEILHFLQSSCFMAINQTKVSPITSKKPEPSWASLIIHNGTFQYTRVPFGMHFAPSAFQPAMQTLLVFMDN